VKRWIAEWLWRAAVLCLLALIGWELQRVHDDLMSPPFDDTTSTVAEAPDVQDIDGLRDDIAVLAKKVDAILIVMARAK
jgi:hypothetical protein